MCQIWGVEKCSLGGGKVSIWGVEMCQIWGVEMCQDEVNYYRLCNGFTFRQENFSFFCIYRDIRIYPFSSATCMRVLCCVLQNLYSCQWTDSTLCESLHYKASLQKCTGGHSLKPSKKHQYVRYYPGKFHDITTAFYHQLFIRECTTDIQIWTKTSFHSKYICWQSAGCIADGQAIADYLGGQKGVKRVQVAWGAGH